MPLKLLLPIFTLVASTTWAQQTAIVPEANPGRPTVSTPATLTPVGYLQFESGAFGATDSRDFSTRVNASEVVKLALHTKLQLLVEAEPLAHTTGDREQTKFGDVFAGLQAVMLGGHEPGLTLSGSFFHKIREANLPEVDFGSPRNSALILLSGNMLGFHFDANGLINELEEDSRRRLQSGETLSISHPAGQFTISGEIWHFPQPFLKGQAVGNLWAIAYPVRKNLVVDGGFDRGLTSTSTQWEAFVGFTYLLPHRLW